MLVAVLFLLVTTPSFGATSFTRDLTLGSRGSDVTALQTFLYEKGLLTAENLSGYFGQLTKTALTRYQVLSRIRPANGFFGPVTRTYITEHETETATTTATSTITIKTPNGGETYNQKDKIKITWDSSSSLKNSKVYIYADRDTSLERAIPIARNVKNSGSYTTTLPSGVYKISVRTELEKTTYQDSSDNYFTVASTTVVTKPKNPSVSVFNPNRAATYKAGSSINTQWKSRDLSSTSTIDLDLESASGTLISLKGSLTNDGYETVKIPESVPAGSYRLKVSTNNSGTVLKDYSDEAFTITTIASNTATSTPPVLDPGAPNYTITVTDVPSATYKAGNPINLQWKKTSGNLTANSLINITIVNASGVATPLKSSIKNTGYTTIIIPTGLTEGMYYINVVGTNAQGRTNQFSIDK